MNGSHRLPAEFGRENRPGDRPAGGVAPAPPELVADSVISPPLRERMAAGDGPIGVVVELNAGYPNAADRVLDSGIQGDHGHFAPHQNLAGLPHRSFVDDDPLRDDAGHGTHFAGILAGEQMAGDAGPLLGALWYQDDSGAAQANLAIAIIMRQQYLINALCRLATRAPTTWPLRLRWTLAKVYHLGGLHVGAAVSGTLWYLAFVVALTGEALHGAGVGPWRTDRRHGQRAETLQAGGLCGNRQRHRPDAGPPAGRRGAGTSGVGHP